MAHPMTKMGLHEKALPIAKVAVTNAVLGKINENHAMEKTSRPGPMTDQWAPLAMKKKNIASLNHQSMSSKKV
jgi:hypothetical protein